MNSAGFIFKEIRKQNALTLEKCAQLTGKSKSWLSAIENGKTNSVTQDELNALVTLIGCPSKIQIPTNKKRPQEISFTGAIIKYLREKKGLSLKEAAQKLDFSPAHLSRLENGLKPISDKVRDQALLAYGYSPSTFKNYFSNDKRSQAVPPRYKLDILLNALECRYLGEGLHR